MKKLDKWARFLEGVSSLICLYPNENRRKITLPGSSICGALKNDWEKVGLDMWNAYRAIESQHLEVKQQGNRNDGFGKSPKHYS